MSLSAGWGWEGVRVDDFDVRVYQVLGSMLIPSFPLFSNQPLCPIHYQINSGMFFSVLME